MTEKGCDNCYYTYFDERAYPCSLCIRGIERTDKWQPSKKTKADRKTEPQMEYPTEWCEKCELWREDNCMGVAQCKRNIQILAEAYKQTEPQTKL